jgi:hypothetical protein
LADSLATLYRYAARPFSKQLLIMGGLRVGTLHDFRRIEHQQGIADPQEGKKNISHTARHLEHKNGRWTGAPADLEAFEGLGMKPKFQIGPNATVTMTNSTFVQTFDHPDCFVLCMSERRSKETMEQFGGADSCVEIVNIPAFFDLLTATLNSLEGVAFQGVHRVTYKTRSEQWRKRDQAANPALIKEPSFAPQCEARAVWMPRRGGRIEPLVLGDYRLGRYCREVSV